MPSEQELLDHLALVGSHPYEKEVNTILTHLDTLMVETNGFNDAVAQLSREFNNSARGTFNQAIPAIIQLGEVLIQIPQTTDGTNRRILIGEAKASGSFLSTTFQALVGLGETAIRSGELQKTKNEELQDRVALPLQRITELIQIAEVWVRSALELKTMKEDDASRYRREAEETRSLFRQPNEESKATR